MDEQPHADFLDWLAYRRKVAEERIAAMTPEDHAKIMRGNALLSHIAKRTAKPK
jgi:hypothetical protein